MSKTIKELIDTLAQATGLTKKAAEAGLVAVFGSMGEELKSGGEVTVRDFGRFYGKQRDARTARNPRTGEQVQVPAKTVIKFAPRGAMK
jgi:DNA-binding protein HU-beta